MKSITRGGVIAALTLLFAVLAGLPAHAADAAPITRWDTQITLREDGVAEVRTEFEMDFSQQKGRGPIVVVSERQRTNNQDEWIFFDISEIQVSSPSGANTDVKTQTTRGVRTVRVGEENTVYKTPQTYVFEYTIKGLIVPDKADPQRENMDQFSWDVISPAWEGDVSNLTVKISGPAAPLDAACFKDYRNSNQECSASVDGDAATMQVDSVPARTGVQVVAGYPVGTFPGVTQDIRVLEEPEEVDPFALTPATGVTTGLLSVGAVVALVAMDRRHARDDVYLGLTPGLTPGPGQEGTIGKAAGKAPVAVQFHPPRGVRPGELGTVMDSTADSVDISATVIDLAVRGHILIEPQDKKGKNVILHRREANDELAPYEAQLLRRIFKGSQTRTMKELRGEQFAGLQQKSKNDLYQTVVNHGWFKGNPQSSQSVPLGIGSMMLAGALGVAFFAGAFGWGLLAVPMGLFGLGLILISGRFRTRTAKGSAVLAQGKGFELYLRTAEADTIRFEENEDIFSKYLPYAMIFGVADRWAKIFADLGARGLYQADLSWYYGADLYNYMVFSNMVNNFSHGLDSAMSSAASAAIANNIQSATGSSSGFSGFSGGGGFSGGSFGGGSW